MCFATVALPDSMPKCGIGGMNRDYGWVQDWGLQLKKLVVEFLFARHSAFCIHRMNQT
jgi:hypothetical protein